MSFYFSYDADQLHTIIESKCSQEVMQKLYTKDELHCTMLFSNGEFQKEYNTLKFDKTTVTVKELAMWEHKGRFFIVAKIDGDKLYEYHDKIKETFNLKDDGDFLPHVTLQRTNNKDDLININDLNYLVGHSIELKDFRCIPMKNKNIDTLKKLKI